MIHSESGGILTFDEVKDIAKVKVLEGEQKDKIFWAIVPEYLTISVGNVVFVFIDGKKQKAEILRIDECVSPKIIPFSVKQITKKVK